MLHAVISVAGDAFGEFSLCQLRMHTFQEIFLFIYMTFAARVAHRFDAWRHRAMSAMTAGALRNREIILFVQGFAMHAFLVGINNIRRKLVMIHELLIAMAFSAGLGKVGGINTAIGVRDAGDIMITVAIRAGGDFLVAFQKKLFAVHARLIPRQLVRPYAVKVHRLDVRVALAAFFNDLLFIRDTDITRGRSFSLFFGCLCRVTAMAAIAQDALLTVNASFYLIPIILMAGDAGISFGSLSP